MKDNSLDDIVKMTRHLQSQMKESLTYIRREINFIIKSKSTYGRNIEKILDTLLDYSYLGIGEKEFKRLNKYYSTIDPEYSKRYDEFYNETLDDK